MDDSGAILCQISAYKDKLDEVNEEIEQNIQKTREIESEIVKCAEVEKDSVNKESELLKMLSMGDFELNHVFKQAMNLECRLGSSLTSRTRESYLSPSRSMPPFM
ncbi:hypothetical protein J5N97_021036 [Dioscorea zingiberensis]|uniref:Uncharacterized protein n=1 Tax=Dioscorea zingiberensis TaxID=325984 RepID=A0A9D5CI95_9LILI|nr:hypothetical protein J5N97_021036 [Dioscorea zingiberensis]